MYVQGFTKSSAMTSLIRVLVRVVLFRRAAQLRDNGLFAIVQRPRAVVSCILSVDTR